MPSDVGPEFTAVVPVRSGSARLPGKMCRPFHGQRTLPEIVVSEVLRVVDASRVVIATTRSLDDDGLVALAAELGVRCHRGSEDDVLARMVGATADAPAPFVIRVCADNPFIRAADIVALTELADGDETCDYAAFQLRDGTPAIQSHIGLYTEVIRRSILNGLAAATSAPEHREHPTSFVLEHSRAFHCRFLTVPERIQSLSDLRLTVDTASDFRTCRHLYQRVVARSGDTFALPDVLDEIERRPGHLRAMRREIAANPKR